MPNRSAPFVRGIGGLALTCLLLVVACQSDDPPEKEATAEKEKEATAEKKTSPPMVAPSEGSLEQHLDPRTLATRYLRYAYQGALLSSDHPLNDSLAALMAGAVGGRTLTVIDTFQVESVQAAEDSGHTVRARFPRSMQIQSVSWTTSASSADAHRSLRIRENHIREAPHIVGWPAFQRHLRDVAPAAADSVLPRMRSAFEDSSPKAGV